MQLCCSGGPTGIGRTMVVLRHSECGNPTNEKLMASLHVAGVFSFSFFESAVVLS